MGSLINFSIRLHNPLAMSPSFIGSEISIPAYIVPAGLYLSFPWSCKTTRRLFFENIRSFQYGSTSAGLVAGLHIMRSRPENRSVSMGIGVSEFNGNGSYLPSNDRAVVSRVGMTFILCCRLRLLLFILLMSVVTVGGIILGKDIVRLTFPLLEGDSDPDV